jgi:hypothetical protein
MCSICWEDTKEKCISLQNNIFTDPIEKYKVSCSCNIIIHKTCMNNWIQKNKSCPICRYTLVKYKPYYLFVWFILKKIMNYFYFVIINIILLILVYSFIFILYLIFLFGIQVNITLH